MQPATAGTLQVAIAAACFGATAVTLYLCFQHKHSWRRLWAELTGSRQQGTHVVGGVVGAVGNTPLICIESLSKATGCKVRWPAVHTHHPTWQQGLSDRCWQHVHTLHSAIVLGWQLVSSLTSISRLADPGQSRVSQSWRQCEGPGGPAYCAGGAGEWTPTYWLACARP